MDDSTKNVKKLQLRENAGKRNKGGANGGGKSRMIIEKSPSIPIIYSYFNSVKVFFLFELRKYRMRMLLSVFHVVFNRSVFSSFPREIASFQNRATHDV